mmetsp:Transcript_27768/g.78795  ORF Transcript_27768/g.78795 Transcript_27768/m.78795 type:complete len:228 (+) Transcript_27768:82-765(+)
MTPPPPLGGAGAAGTSTTGSCLPPPPVRGAGVVVVSSWRPPLPERATGASSTTSSCLPPLPVRGASGAGSSAALRPPLPERAAAAMISAATASASRSRSAAFRPPLPERVLGTGLSRSPSSNCSTSGIGSSTPSSFSSVALSFLMTVLEASWRGISLFTMRPAGFAGRLYKWIERVGVQTMSAESNSHLMLALGMSSMASRSWTEVTTGVSSPMTFSCRSSWYSSSS